MARPTWVTVVGVLGILFGCSGILSGGQQVLMPKMLEMQKAMFASMSENAERTSKNTNCDVTNNVITNTGSSGLGARVPDAPCRKSIAFPPPQFAEMFKDMWNVPPWFATWMQISGLMRCLVGAVYLFGAIWLIQMKRSSIAIFSTALALSIILGSAQIVVGFSFGSILVGAMMAGSGAGLFIDIVLLLVIWLSDRSAFQQTTRSNELSRAL